MMTQEDAKKVKVGDFLITKLGKYCTVQVAKIHTGYYSGIIQCFECYKKGAKRFDKLQNPISGVRRTPAEVGWAPENECIKDPLTANVYADFLDDKGFSEAAKVLREAFPIYKREE